MRRELLGVVEAAYRLDDADADWIDRLVHAAAPLLDRGHGVAGYLLDDTPHDPVLVGRDPWGGGWRDEWWERHIAPMPARFAKELAGFGSPTFASQSCGALARGEVVARLAQELPPLELPRGVREALIISAYNFGGSGAVLFAFRDQRVDETPSGREAATLERISGHLAAALRLRRVRRPPEEVSARVARNVDRARRGEVGLAAWTPIQRDGRSVVPSGGGYFAQPNEPRGPALGSLTARERAAVALLDLGRSNKAIAYEMGIAISTAGSLLSSAAKKLGVTRARDLIGRTRALVHLSPEPELTESEAVVLALMIAGLSDREIADSRGTVRGTVTKQIDGIYKKLGVSSRRELAARFSSFAPWTLPD